MREEVPSLIVPGTPGLRRTNAGIVVPRATGASIPTISDLADPMSLWIADSETYLDTARTLPAIEDGDLVAGWGDQGGNFPASQATEAQRPTLKLNIQNGHSALRFAIDYLTTSALIPATGAGARALLAVVTNVVSGGGAFEHILHYGEFNNGGRTYGLCSRTASASRFGNHYWATSWSPAAGAWSINTPYIVLIGYDGTNDNLFLNDDTPAVATTTLALNTGSTDTLLIGSRVGPSPAEQAQFDALLIAPYNKFPDATEREAIFATCNNYYTVY